MIKNIVHYIYKVIPKWQPDEKKAMSKNIETTKPGW